MGIYNFGNVEYNDNTNDYMNGNRILLEDITENILLIYASFCFDEVVLVI